jgi:hypothetical protein
VRNGTVTELARPTAITFRQPMTFKLHLGTVDLPLRYTLTPQAGSTQLTHVTRIVTLKIPLSLKLIRPILVRAVRAESTRTLLALKAYADTLP